ncbi:MAG TPA: hypothetical protein VGO62_12395 [Myxococcota bacterium]|jgi:hypothetical protein
MRPALIAVIVVCLAVAGALLYRSSSSSSSTSTSTTPPTSTTAPPLSNDVNAVNAAMAKAKAAHLKGAAGTAGDGTGDAEDVSNPASIAVADAGRVVHTPAVEAAAIASQLNDQALAKAKNAATKKLGQLAPAGLTDDQFAQLRKLVEAEAVELAVSGDAGTAVDVVAVHRETDKNAAAILTDDKQRRAWSRMRDSAD